MGKRLRREKGPSSRLLRVQRRESRKIRSTAAVFSLTLALSLILCGQWIDAWAEKLPSSLARKFLLPLTAMLSKPGEVLGISFISEWGRHSFLAWADPGWTRERLRMASLPLGAGSSSAQGPFPTLSANEALLPEGTSAESRSPVADPERPFPEEKPGSNRVMAEASSPPLEAPRPIPELPWSFSKRESDPVFSVYRPLRILMVGDSIIGQNTQDAMSDWDRQTNWAEVSYSWKLSSTLVDPSRLDWQARIRSLTEEKAWDLIIVVIGSNDGQEMAVGARRIPFNTPDWVNAYDCRLRDFLSVATDRSLKVYWTAVPPMRAPGYRDRMVMLNGHVRSLVKAFPRTRWLDTAEILGNAEGRYTDAKVIDGVQRIVRMADGIHVTIPGAGLLVRAWETMMLEDFLILRID